MREVSFNRQDDGTTYTNLRVDTPTAAIIEADTSRRAQRLGPDDHRPRVRRQADAMVNRLTGDAGPAAEVTISCTETLMGLAAGRRGRVRRSDLG
jgi:hypothetical protein